MATFYTKGKVDLSILIDVFGNAIVTKKCLSYMFGFQSSFIHVFRDDGYDDNNVVKSLVY